MPTIFRELLVEQFDGKIFSRQSAIRIIADYHLQNGGIIEDERDLVGVFKRATQVMQKQNMGLVNKGYGTWELHYKKQEQQIVKESYEMVEKNYNVDEIIGSGDRAVYVYYFDSYAEKNALKGNSTWECKIGRNDNNPIQRILGQVGTCFPELPHIALIIKCDDSVTLEAALHSVLKVQGKWISKAPGNEWFMTNPKEIKELYYRVIKKLDERYLPYSSLIDVETVTVEEPLRLLI